MSSNPAFVENEALQKGEKAVEAAGDGGMTSSSPPPKYEEAEHHSVNISHESLVPDKPYSGMNKEELLRFSDTPFWNNLRLACFVSQPTHIDRTP